MFDLFRIQGYPTANSNILWAEVQGEAVIAATGLPYQQESVMRLEIRNGLVVHYREYWNPRIVSERWANT